MPLAVGTARNEREVGRVTSVSSYRLTVLLDPQVRSQVRAYPERIGVVTQIGGYLLFPVSPGELAVGIIVGASEDESIEPDAERGMTLQLGLARRNLRLNLLGQLFEDRPFIPGISIYPTLDTPALLPTEDELERILEFRPAEPEKEKDTALPVGVSPIYLRQEVTVSYNDLLARPLGIIGNTGSGKSYSVASFIQEACHLEGGKASQAKFIILDINGEYRKAFGSVSSPEKTERTSKELNRVYVSGGPFFLPLWTFNLTELVAFFEASQASQVPVLERVITSLREEAVDPEPVRDLRRLVRLVDQCLDCLGSLSAYSVEQNGMAVPDNAAEVLSHLLQYSSGLEGLATDRVDLPEKIKQINDEAQKIYSAGLKQVDEYKQMRNKKDYTNFNRMEPNVSKAFEKFVEDLELEFHRLRQDVITKGGLTEVTADSPVKFNVRGLEQDALFHNAISRFRGQERIQEYVATLRLRIHRQLSDRRWSVFTQSSNEDFQTIIARICGLDDARVVVIDCSMLAYDALPFFCAVLGRLVLDLRAHGKAGERTVQPFVLVLEEAHNYLRPRRDDESPGIRLSREAFERIAKEGRKFGLSLIIASQRPSDVSATVLSQCANFLVHRIQNPDDIDYFKKILPTGSRDLLDQLPILAPGDGLLIGSAVNVPARVQVRKPNPQPSSETPKPWEAWQKNKQKFDLKESISSWSQDRGGGSSG